MSNIDNIKHDTYWANLWLLLATSDVQELPNKTKETIRSELSNIKQDLISHTNTLIDAINSVIQKVS